MQHLHQDRSRRMDRHAFGHRAGDRQVTLAESYSPAAEAAEPDPENCMPLFISDRNGEPEPSEYIVPPLRTRRASSITAKLLTGVCAASIAAVLSAWFSSNSARDFLWASFADLIPAPMAATPPASQPLTAPTTSASSQMPVPENGPIVAKADVGTVPGGVNNADHIDQAHGPIPAIVEAPKPPPIVIHHLNAGEIAAALARADDLIASGDIAAARLVLRPAAQSEDANAAIKLAGTYDPDILSRLGVHGIAPDSVKAQEWYEKASKFGAPEAATRLEALASRRH